jgi:hypothetical protein
VRQLPHPTSPEREKQPDLNSLRWVSELARSRSFTPPEAVRVITRDSMQLSTAALQRRRTLPNCSRIVRTSERYCVVLRYGFDS